MVIERTKRVFQVAWSINLHALQASFGFIDLEDRISIDHEIEAVLASCEAKLTAGDDLDLTTEGFWRAVGRVKRNPTLIDTYADRIGLVDRMGFENWVFRGFPIKFGETLLWIGTFIGLAVIACGYYVDEPWNGWLLIAGTAVLLLTTHGLGHLIVGRVVGIRFTHWFIGSWSRPQPGVKTDYASYLRTEPTRRAWMHASGALVTKAVPFLMFGAAWGMEAPTWAWIALSAVGIVQIFTDATMSVKQSDWKKFNREMNIARAMNDGA